MQWWCVAQSVPWSWEWRAYPGVWLFLLGLAGLRWILLRRSGSGPEVTAGRRWAFGTGLLALWLALDWPLGALGAGYLASAHMLQFLLIALVAPPFLLLSLPRSSYRRIELRGVLEKVASLVVHPLSALLAFALTVGWTHWPPVVDSWMASQLGSFALDMVWLGAGLVFWWPVAAPRPRPDWFGLPARVAYLIVATIANTGVFMYLTYAQLPLYEIYELAPPTGWLTTREDQILAGLFMKLGGGLVLWTAITILFGRWYLESEGKLSGERTGAPGARGTREALKP